jgi:uncharacterized ion transporter superfamily protein YfcC
MPHSRFPHPLVLIFAMIVVAQILSYVLPAGSFEREPRPSAGAPWADAPDGAALRTRLAAAREQRGVVLAELAARFSVSERTVEGWELGPPPPQGPWHSGTHIEATVGALLERWVASGEWPSAAEVAAWKAARAGDRQRVLRGTWRELERAEPLPWYASFTKIPVGMMAAGEIIFFVFIIGGVIAVMRATGAIDALICRSLRAFGHRPVLLIGGTTALFALGSSAIGMAEEYLPFVPILVTMGLAMRMDAVVALGIVYVGAGVGYGCAALNPFTVVIAQDIAGLQTYSGQWYRWLLLVLCLAVGVHHLMRYARRVVADPSRSLVADVDYSSGFEMPADVALTPARMLVLALFVGGIVLFVYGVSAHEWYLTEMSAIFLGIGVLAAIVGRIGVNRTASEFCKGAAELSTTALLIGFARTIQVVLDDGRIIDTVIHGIAGSLDQLGSHAAAIGMLAVQTVCNLFIPSGSGQAYVTMPIMAPVADLTGVTRQSAVLAYQFGDGFTNAVVPTNPVLMGMLALSRIPYQRWLRFIVPLLVKIYVIAIAALCLAVAIEYQ